MSLSNPIDQNPKIQKQKPLASVREPVFWRDVGKLTVAHPWLIYAELMNSEDPRSHEAAEELRREFLPS